MTFPYDHPDWLGVPPVGGGLVLPTTVYPVVAGTATGTPAAYVGNQEAITVQYGAESAGPFTLSGLWLPAPADTDQEWPFLWTAHLIQGQAHYLTMPVQAPWVILAATTTGAGTQDVTLGILGQSGGAQSIPSFPTQTVLDVQGTSIGAGANQTFYPAQSAPGRYQLFLLSISATAVARILEWSGTAWEVAGQAVPVAVNTPQIVDIPVGVSDWAIQIFNTGGAASSMFCTVRGPL